MSETVYLRTSSAAIREAISKLPQQLKNDSAVSGAIMTRVGMAALGHIKKAFVDKARGGADEAGERWAPLSRRTIAYSRRGRTGAERKRAPRPSQALNRSQSDRWWELYRQGKAMYKGDKSRAAKRAWVILKSEGAQTLLDKYGNRQVEILRDTGPLFNSLSPGVASPHRVFRVSGTSVTIGTNRQGALDHHEGRKGLPQRRLWPDPKNWPASWWADIIEQAKQGLIDVTLSSLRGS